MYDKEKAAKYREKNRGRIRAYMVKYRKKTRDETRVYMREYRKRHETGLYNYHREWRTENQAKVARYGRIWKEKNKAKVRQLAKRWRSKQMNKLYLRILQAINKAIKRRGNSRIITDSLPYTLKELKAHLEGNFESGMNWENYGKWSIDHIIPNSWFEYESPADEEFKAAWELNNLRPMWLNENLLKKSLGFKRKYYN